MPMKSETKEMAEKSISIVVPVYGCVDCLEILCSRLSDSVSTVAQNFEIILVDDCSPDGSWERIAEIQQRMPFVHGIRLSRNYGQHIAITAGLQAAKGDLIVVMDCDLQDPPELIPQLYSELSGGYDYILGIRVQRNHSFFRVYSAKLYFRLLSKLTKQKIDPGAGSFAILTRKVVDAFNLFTERDRHFLFILRWLGFHGGSVDYTHAERFAGKSSYSWKALIKHAVDGLFFQTTVFLRWIVFTGMLFSISGVVFAIYLVFQYFVRDIAEGWTSLATLILVSTGALMISLGVVGLYVGKIFDQTRQRPLYLIDTVIERISKW